jgi:hypothetical protein
LLLNALSLDLRTGSRLVSGVVSGLPQKQPLHRPGRTEMQDAVMLLFTVIFFCLAFLYVKACHKLR